MTFWIKEISWKKILAVSSLFTIISFVVRQVEAMLTMNYYKMPEFFGGLEQTYDAESRTATSWLYDYFFGFYFCNRDLFGSNLLLPQRSFAQGKS